MGKYIHEELLIYWLRYVFMQYIRGDMQIACGVLLYCVFVLTDFTHILQGYFNSTGAIMNGKVIIMTALLRQEVFDVLSMKASEDTALQW